MARACTGVGSVTWVKRAPDGCEDNRQRLRVRLARCISKLSKLWTGRPSAVCRSRFLALALVDDRAGAIAAPAGNSRANASIADMASTSGLMCPATTGRWRAFNSANRLLESTEFQPTERLAVPQSA